MIYNLNDSKQSATSLIADTQAFSLSASWLSDSIYELVNSASLLDNQVISIDGVFGFV